MIYPQVKEAFKLPCENAIDAANLGGFIVYLQHGPEWEWETTEESPKRYVSKTINCPWFKRYTEFGIKPEDMVCPGGHIAFVGEGLKTVNPKIKHTLTKAVPWGDDYCEDVWEMEE